MTGGAITARADAFLRSVANVRFEKPFDTASLLGLIRERLGGEAAPSAGGA
jgi:hypothetical protein